MSPRFRKSANISLQPLPDQCLGPFRTSVCRVWQRIGDFHIPTRHVHGPTIIARHKLLVIPAWLSRHLFLPFETESGGACLLLLDSETIVLPSQNSLVVDCSFYEGGFTGGGVVHELDCQFKLLILSGGMLKLSRILRTRGAQGNVLRIKVEADLTTGKRGARPQAFILFLPFLTLPCMIATPMEFLPNRLVVENFLGSPLAFSRRPDPNRSAYEQSRSCRLSFPLTRIGI